jgi:hypothetical protein
MKSSSIKLALEAGIPNAREYRDALIHEWYLQPQYSEKLDIYVLRETTPEKLFFHLKDGELLVNGKSYSVTWINGTRACREANYLLVSLRYCRHLERGYALVKVLQGTSVEYLQLDY